MKVYHLSMTNFRNGNTVYHISDYNGIISEHTKSILSKSHIHAISTSPTMLTYFFVYEYIHRLEKPNGLYVEFIKFIKIKREKNINDILK